MWKVKRMNTARIVVLATAESAGGIAAYLVTKDEPVTANGADWMAAELPTGIRIPGLIKTLK